MLQNIPSNVIMTTIIYYVQWKTNSFFPPGTPNGDDSLLCARPIRIKTWTYIMSVQKYVRIDSSEITYPHWQ